MRWYDKFKVGQRVKVVKKIGSWRFAGFCNGNGFTDRGATWVWDMDKTIGGVFEIVKIDSNVGYRLGTKESVGYDYNYWYPVESLEAENVKGQQLLFNFMKE